MGQASVAEQRTTVGPLLEGLIETKHSNEGALRHPQLDALAAELATKAEQLGRP